MRVKMVAGMLVGSVVVAAACSAQHALDNPSDKDSGVLDALLDAVSSDTKDAVAGGFGTVDEVACDKLVGTTGKAWFGEKAYPGRTRADLSRGVAMVCQASPDLDGYACVQTPMQVKDGGVRVMCTLEGTPGPRPTAVVVMPSG
jgi:hypothetical protein